MYFASGFLHLKGYLSLLSIEIIETREKERKLMQDVYQKLKKEADEKY